MKRDNRNSGLGKAMFQNANFELGSNLWINCGNPTKLSTRNWRKYVIIYCCPSNFVGPWRRGIRSSDRAPSDPEALGWMGSVGQEAFGWKGSAGRRPSGPRPSDREARRRRGRRAGKPFGGSVRGGRRFRAADPAGRDTGRRKGHGPGSPRAERFGGAGPSGRAPTSREARRRNGPRAGKPSGGTVWRSGAFGSRAKEPESAKTERSTGSSCFRAALSVGWGSSDHRDNGSDCLKTDRSRRRQEGSSEHAARTPRPRTWRLHLFQLPISSDDLAPRRRHARRQRPDSSSTPWRIPSRAAVRKDPRPCTWHGVGNSGPDSEQLHFDAGIGSLTIY